MENSRSMQNNSFKHLIIGHWTGSDKSKTLFTLFIFSTHPQAGQTLTEDQLEIGFLWPVITSDHLTESGAKPKVAQPYRGPRGLHLDQYMASLSSNNYTPRATT